MIVLIIYYDASYDVCPSVRSVYSRNIKFATRGWTGGAISLNRDHVTRVTRESSFALRKLPRINKSLSAIVAALSSASSPPYLVFVFVENTSAVSNPESRRNPAAITRRPKGQMPPAASRPRLRATCCAAATYFRIRPAPPGARHPRPI